MKGGFQNIDVTRELEKSKEGRKWILWVRKFLELESLSSNGTEIRKGRAKQTS